MSKEESFEEWFKKNKSPAAFSPYGKEMEEMTSWQAWNHQQWQAWNHQQAKLDEANERIDELEKESFEDSEKKNKVFLELRQKEDKLESENKRLRERTTELDGFLKTANSHINKLIEENKQLKKRLDFEKKMNDASLENIGNLTDALKLAVEVIRFYRYFDDNGTRSKQFLESEQYKKVEGSL
jgi:chromosome segregation ATPase